MNYCDNRKISNRLDAISIDEYESMRETIYVLSDVSIMEQLEEGKKSTKVRDFEELAEELGIKKYSQISSRKHSDKTATIHPNI